MPTQQQEIAVIEEKAEKLPYGSSEEQINVTIKPKAEVKAYILSLPDYSHTLSELQMHFYGRTFPSRKNTARMYHKLANQLRQIHSEIEKEQKGTFNGINDPEGKKRYVFERKATAKPMSEIFA